MSAAGASPEAASDPASAPDLLLIAGPTAAGKTALALHAAARLGAEIVNADSMQVYQGLETLAAAPSPEERAAAPHHLFGVIDPGERCSVGRWSRMALQAVEEIRARGRRAVLVGGTGLYFKALTEGLAPAPEVSAQARARAAAILDGGGLAALREAALRLDPEAAERIEAGDRQRLLRVVEVALSGPEPLSRLQARTAPLIAPEAWVGVVLEPPRAALYARIEARYAAMVRAGALEEARALRARGLDRDLPAMKAVGLPPLLAYLDGALDLDAATAEGARDTRRYAKRQFTWFRNQHPGWARIAGLDPERQRAELEPLLHERFPGA